MNDIFSFIRYANCWEDSDVLSKALQIKDTDVGVSIASAGDNTMALLLDNPSKIYAIDINKTQLYLFELKIAAFKNLEYEDTLKLLGVKETDKRENIYKNIQKDMSKEAIDYFNEHIDLIEKGVIHVGKFEKYFQLFNKKIVPLFASRKRTKEFIKLDDIKEQQSFYNKYINTLRLKLVFKTFFGVKTIGKYGRDKSFFDYVDEKNNVSKNLKTRFEQGVFNTINKTNPYLSYIFINNFTSDALPTYLKKENYEIIRNRLDRIELVNGDLYSIKDTKIDFFNLSDIFEYMNEEVFKENVDKIVEISNTNARLAYWNMQSNKYIDNNNMKLDEELSKELFIKDRAYFYKDFFVYNIRGENNE